MYSPFIKLLLDERLPAKIWQWWFTTPHHAGQCRFVKEGANISNITPLILALAWNQTSIARLVTQYCTLITTSQLRPLFLISCQM